MMSRMGRGGIVAVLLLMPGRAAAQEPFPGRLDASQPAVPALSVSFAAGPMQFQGRVVTMGMAGVQIGMGRHLVLEPELTRWVEADAPGLQALGAAAYETRRRAVTTAGANVLFRAGAKRVVGFVGGGAGFGVIKNFFDCPVNPSTGARVGGGGVATSETSLDLHGIGGVDVVVAPRLRAFAAIRGDVAPEMNLGVAIGARFVLRADGEGRSEPRGARGPSGTRSAARGVTAEGRTVDVLRLDGHRVSGRLIALSLDEVAIAGHAGDLRIRLSDVRRVQRSAHWARNLGLASAAVFGGLALGSCTTGHCGSEGLAALTLMGAAVTGGAVAIGGMINSATASGRMIYP